MDSAQKIPLPSIFLFLLSAFIFSFAYIRWEDVVIQHPDGSYSLHDDFSDKANDRVDRLKNKTEFYRLVAETDGYYVCPLCPPESTTNGKFFLYYGETYKYGISMDAKGRYTKAELLRWKLRYERIAVGSYSEMLILETTHMAEYPILPENLKRAKNRKLATPPGSGTRLQ